ncbi:PadR family transcriptional regulator [Eupransor demetentiae]|uniref:PadR family (PadR) n=1 Tax=Eupransor demetentiae TaxID=3109584 RepID=A0ABP0ESL9_9LACO|nr:DNA-binding transcriptional regulator [Lactobacillaceae bacterium LMG 33000]
MAIKIPNRVLEAVVLQALKEEPLYGYALTKKIQSHIPISDSTTYPVLRKLQKLDYVSTESVVFAERVRKYYRITANGEQYLKEAKQDWRDFSMAVNQVLGE